MIISQLTSVNIIPNNIDLFFFKFEYRSYNGYKSQIVNNFVNGLTAPFDCIHYIFGCFFGNLLFVVPQIIYYSPNIIHFGFHSVLKKIDDWLVPQE